MPNKIKVIARGAMESLAYAGRFILKFAILLADGLTFLVSHYWGWPVSLVWIGIVGFVILQPETAQDWDKIGTIPQWKLLTGGTADPSSMLRNLGWLLITAIGLPMLVWRTFVAAKQAKTGIKRTEQVAKQLELARQGQSADRYVKAAAMLSDEKISVREAGIFALRQLAISDPVEYYFPVQDLLCSFMRDYGQKDRKEANVKASSSPLALAPRNDAETPRCKSCSSDVTAALRAFSDLRTEENMKREQAYGWEPELEQCNFNDFPGHSKAINLQNAGLRNAQLQGAYLIEAQLQNSFLHEAQMQSAILPKAVLQRANLRKAKLQGAHLNGAEMQRAGLRGALMERAELKGAKLQNAFLWNAQLQGVDLIEANLQGAYLCNAQLQCACLMEAQLQGAIFNDAQLQRTIFKKAQLEGAELKNADCHSADFRETQLQKWQLDEIDDLTAAKFSIPIWSEEACPDGWQFSDIQRDVLGEYFTFIRTEECSDK